MTAAGRAEELARQGFTRVRVLGGGVDAWKRAGFPIVPKPSLLGWLRRRFRRGDGR